MQRTWALVDVAVVLVFVAIGRTVHDHGNRLAGLASTSWPFLVGLVVAWFVLSWRGHAGRSPRDGVAVALITVAVGMILRVLVGQGTAVAFIVVAVVFLGVPMVAWRFACRVLRRRRGHDTVS